MSLAAPHPIQRWLDLLSERLARHRLNQNLTQSELARAAGISLRTIARLENGEPVQLESFLRALMALGLSDGLHRVVPEVPESPMEQLERSGRRRKRATGSRKGGKHENGKPEEKPWSWGESS